VIVDVIWFIANQLKRDDTPDRITAKLCVWDADKATKEMVRKALVESGKLG
jgi:hypothetical protein